MEMDSYEYTTCALLKNGSVKCWGTGNEGQLGLGDPTVLYRELASEAMPVPLNGLATELSTGSRFSCVVLRNGEVQCWGNNVYGQLGLGHTRNIGDDEAPTTRTVIEGTGLDLIARFKKSHLLGPVNEAISFDASTSYSESEMVSYSWDFGDESDSQTGQNITHMFASPGTYDVTLTVTDARSRTHSFSQKVTIVSVGSGDESDGEESENSENGGGGRHDTSDEESYGEEIEGSSGEYKSEKFRYEEYEEIDGPIEEGEDFENYEDVTRSGRWIYDMLGVLARGS